MRRGIKEGLVVLLQVGVHVQSDHLAISRQGLGHGQRAVARVHAHVQHAPGALTADQGLEELTCTYTVTNSHVCADSGGGGGD